MLNRPGRCQKWYLMVKREMSKIYSSEEGSERGNNCVIAERESLLCSESLSGQDEKYRLSTIRVA